MSSLTPRGQGGHILYTRNFLLWSHEKEVLGCNKPFNVCWPSLSATQPVSSHLELTTSKITLRKLADSYPYKFCHICLYSCVHSLVHWWNCCRTLNKFLTKLNHGECPQKGGYSVDAVHKGWPYTLSEIHTQDHSTNFASVLKLTTWIQVKFCADTD